MELTKVNAQDIIPGNVIYALKGEGSMVLEAQSGPLDNDKVLKSMVSGVDIPLKDILDWDLYLLGHMVRNSNYRMGLVVPGIQELSVGDFVVDVWNSDCSRFTGIVVDVNTSTPGGEFVEVVTCHYDYSYLSSGKLVTSNNLIVEFDQLPLDIATRNYKKFVYKDSTFEINKEMIIGKLTLSVGPDAVSKLLVALDKVEGRNESN